MAIIGVGANGWWYLGIDMGLETGVDDGCWEGKEKANLNLPGTISLGWWDGGHRCRLRFIVFE